METKYRPSEKSHYATTINSLKTEVNKTEILPQRLHYFFESRCDVAPDAVALVSETEQLTYSQLDKRANQLAHYLVRNGIKSGDKIGILLEKSVNTYITLLAILKSGAAFVPLDPSFPEDRIAFIAENASLKLLITTANFNDITAGLYCQVLMLDIVATDIKIQKTNRITPQNIESRNIEDALCYIIYTSGSTGRPKGVAVNHSSICNFLNVCTPIYGVNSWDRVYQGMIIAFDFSIEEIWPTFVVGATLIIGPTDHRRIGTDLADFLIDHAVTIMYCVPTLLATLDKDVPSLRTLIVGGEACPQDLVNRWSNPKRRMLNTYGPTEATVTAIWTELFPNKPVTIGKPLPTYSIYILDEDLRPVPQGKVGEICIGGIGVACGYVNLPEQTADKFVFDPFQRSRGHGKMYRTGDLGRLTVSGDIEYLGRIDSQVKIRGYRVELTEIEAVLLENPAVENTIVTVVSGNGSLQELAAYITLRVSNSDPENLKHILHESLRSRLPNYMVPAFIEIIDTMPTLPNGKADRAKLPVPISTRLSHHSGKYIAPETSLEKELAEAWGIVFGEKNISVEDDFFNDLGGHSLFAAQVVSQLRKNPKLHHLSIAELYTHATIRKLAQHIESLSAVRYTTDLGVGKSELFNYKKLASNKRRYRNVQVWICGALQMILLYLLFTVLGSPTALLLKAIHSSAILLAIAGSFLLPASWIFTVLVLPIVAKWLLIGRFREGRYPIWGWYYCRWWLVQKILGLVPLNYLAGSPLMSVYMRLLGARIGKGCHIGTAHLHLPDLIEIGDEVSIGYGVELQPFLVSDGWLYQAPISIGNHAFVGTNSVIMLGGTVGKEARLAEQSLVTQHQTIPDYETWAGSPSQQSTETDPILDEMASKQLPKSPLSPKLLAGFVVGFFLLIIMPWIIVSPGMMFIYEISNGVFWREIAAAPMAGLMWVITACILVAVGKKLLMPVARAGIFPVDSGFGLRKWLVDNLMQLSLDVTNTLYATLYALPWLRLLGAKVGARAEISTVANIDPDLLTLGAESFVADLVAVGPAKYYNGFVALGPTNIGDRCFVGNSALIPGNTELGNGSLIGVHSVPPHQPVQADSSWLGSPAIFLPRRQKTTCFAESVTFKPPAKLVVCRLAIEFLRVVLPPTLFYCLLISEIKVIFELESQLSTLQMILAMPLIYIGFALLATGIVAALKWIIVGRYRPKVAPNWSHFVWRTELITGLYESVALPWLGEWLTGTPMIAPFFRLFGAKIGRRVYMETTFLTEFDLVRVADDAAIGGATSLQTHLFEDRVMKMSHVRIGSGCTVGPRSVVLYDSVMESGSKLDGLSLLMKSEVLPLNTEWQGIPARLVNGE